MRGFGRSDKPDKVEDYSFGTITADMLGIMDYLDIESAHIVGHDWGAAVAWNLAIRHPDRVNRLVVLSVPHPAVPRNLEQQEKF